jgi:hypothetical protein
MIASYEQQRSAAGLPATFEVIFGAAFGAAIETRMRGDAASAEGYAVPLAALGRSRR